jgi:hypothetical protein
MALELEWLALVEEKFYQEEELRVAKNYAHNL